MRDIYMLVLETLDNCLKSKASEVRKLAIILKKGDIMEEFAPVVAIVFTFGTIGLIWGSIIFTRHKERMTMIERGLKAEDIKSLYIRHTMQLSPLSSLKWGMVIVSVGIAILIGMWMHNVLMFDEGVFPGLIAAFGGLGLVLFYFVANKKVKE